MCSREAKISMQSDLQNSNFDRNPNFLPEREEREFHLVKVVLFRLDMIPCYIPYAYPYIISIQSNFTTIAYARSLKETQSQDRHKFILGNPLGEENPSKLPQYRWLKVQRQKPKQVLLLLADLSLSYVNYTSECVCPNEEHITPIYTLSSTWFFSLTRSSPTNLIGPTYLGRLKTI